MKRNVAATRVSRRRLTWIVLAAAVCLAAGSYGYHLFRLYQQWQHDTPQPQVERLIQDLRRFHAETKQFPSNFHGINQRLWHTRPEPDYGTDGKQARVKNYLYRYTRIETGKCALWALPLGTQREYGTAFFVVLTPEWVRAWQGKALSDTQIEQLPTVPTREELSILALRELPVRQRSASEKLF